MWEEGSTMAPELIAERIIRSTAGMNVTEAEIYALVSEGVQSDVSDLETKELYDSLTRAFVYESARNTLGALQTRMDSPQSLEEAMDIMRGLKALQPEREADLTRQTDAVISEVSNGESGLVPYGIPMLDKALGGMCRGEVTIFAGRPGHGKTSFACQIALNQLRDGFKVLFVSKEMTTSRLIHKLLVNRSVLTSDQMKRGNLTPEQNAVLVVEANALAEKYKDQLFIHDDIYDSHKIETLVAKYQPDVVYDDFIQLSKMDDGNIRLEIMRIMKHYKDMAKSYDLAFATLSQLNRGIEGREDPKPRLSDLAESGSLEQLAADVLFVFYPFKVDYVSPRTYVEILASKTRFGETCTVPLHFSGDHMRYREVPQTS